MTTTKAAFTSQSFLVARAINPAIAENWTDADWDNDSQLAQLRWERVGTITTKPKGKLEFSEDYNLPDVEACQTVGRQVEWLRAKGNESAKLVTVQQRGNVYRVSKM